MVRSGIGHNFDNFRVGDASRHIIGDFFRFKIITRGNRVLS